MEFPEGLTPFQILGVPEALIFSEDELRAKFYQLSKLTHPDHFATRPQREIVASARWSSAVNRAFQLLRDPKERTLFLLEKNQVQLGKTPPAALSELYFEIQDSHEIEELTHFQNNLTTLLSENQAQWDSLASRWPSSGEERLALLKSLAENLVSRRYLNSMLEDVRKRVGALR